ncbi:hypothetical protein F183_A33530 [Bryobacterales bacterium F-183]|nr:hypothetical protein F183_A33530 [Bryobacterales bacterium F-183]
MSNALAIASVTAILRDALHEGLINHRVDSLFSFQVTAQPPDRIAVAEDFNRLNLFLYRVTPNLGWTNAQLPSRSPSGERIDSQFLALDLHYVLSSMSTVDLHAEILLGYGMQVLHEKPVLGRDSIRTALGLGGILPDAFQQLAPSSLADQFEQIKITPYYTDLEEITKIWTAMNTPMRMSALYQVTTVLIDSRLSRRAALPVTQRSLFLRPLQGPSLTRILSKSDGPGSFEPLRPIIHGDILRLEGHALRGDVTIAAVGEFEVAPMEVEGGQITFTLPLALHPGVQGVGVRHRIAKNPPSTEEMPWETSNVLPFLLRPRISNVTASNVTFLNSLAAGTLTVSLTHNVGGRQRTEVLLNERNPPDDRPALAYTFTATPLAGDPLPSEANSRDFEFQNVKSGSYLVRIRVDGAESTLEMTGGTFSGPAVSIQ